MAGRKDQTARASEGSRCTCTALRKASRRISQLYDTALAPSGLKMRQRAILAQISRSEPTTVGALAEALVMDSGALAHTLKPLEPDRLVAIEIDPDERCPSSGFLSNEPSKIREALAHRYGEVRRPAAGAAGGG